MKNPIIDAAWSAIEQRCKRVEPAQSLLQGHDDKTRRPYEPSHATDVKRTIARELLKRAQPSAVVKPIKPFDAEKERQRLKSWEGMLKKRQSDIINARKKTA